MLITRLLNGAGPGLKEGINQLFRNDKATLEQLRLPPDGTVPRAASDDRVELARIDEGWDGPVLSEAISKLLSTSPTSAELRHFLEVTQYELRDQDNRVAIAKIIDGGGP
ncbi:hypothetical protein GCM10010347_26060 [Streptomyces cirratus]|uniref:Uncharacterized protein n=1 Tax=Streptomyces cirratus TaxID=68187 RepID=A0ABQ3EW00_9ACTN|nr:hypothetical protein [Streptomyces cirratus]GHB54965.1 hypothetical protein GCM10010347_26060 [Streptomyces cirratus]